MKAPDELQGLLRRLTSSKELTDELVLETLKTCCLGHYDDVDKKYELMYFCEVGAWEQASLWVFQRCLPSWSLVIEREYGGGYRVVVLSPHEPPLQHERRGVRLGSLVLETIVQSEGAVRRLKIPGLKAAL